MSYRITHPAPVLGRSRFLGIEFIDGTANVESLHPVRLDALQLHGFTINQLPAVDEPEADPDPEVVDLTTLTVAELREIAESEGLDVAPRAKKVDLVDMLSRQPVAPVADPLSVQEV